jgi:hypothetical protein
MYQQQSVSRQKTGQNISAEKVHRQKNGLTNMSIDRQKLSAGKNYLWGHYVSSQSILARTKCVGRQKRYYQHIGSKCIKCIAREI